MKKQPEDIEGPPIREGGSYITGLNLEGARWDISGGYIDESKPREMFSLMPVIHAKAVPETGKEEKNIFYCPVYKTELRGATYVFSAQLKTTPRHKPEKWILAGAALIMDVEGAIK